MDRRSLLGVSASVGTLVAALLSSEVLLRASWLLRPGFDRTAFLVRYGSGPLVGLGLIVLGVGTFVVCRASVERSIQLPVGSDGGSPSLPFLGALAPLAKCAVVGTGAGLILGMAIAWLSIRVDGMGNGGDTSIVQYEILDFGRASVFGVGVFLVAAMSEVARDQVVVSLGLSGRQGTGRAVEAH